MTEKQTCNKMVEYLEENMDCIHIQGHDFMNDISGCEYLYDRIIANPPFRMYSIKRSPP
jgi:methylase of polypeptide subunit release factors